MEILTLSAIIGSSLLSSVTTFLFYKNKGKKDDSLTIVSDGQSVSIEEETNPLINTSTVKTYRIVEQRTKPNTKSKKIDMTNIDGIRLEGSGNAIIDNVRERLLISSNCIIVQKTHTLVIKNKESSTGLFRTNENIEYELINFKKINRISLNGSGSLTSKHLNYGDVQLILKGCGNIKIYDADVKNLEISSLGSGNITIADNCIISNMSANLQGSGNINIDCKIYKYTTSKKGSGKIKIKKVK